MPRARQGVTAYLLLSAGVVLGLTMASHTVFARWPRFSVEDIHRFVGLLVGTFVAIHVVAVAIDAWLPFSLASLVVPFTTRYRPIWVGLGIAAAELLLALAVTNHYRRRLTYRFWRRAHYLNFAVWTARHSPRPRKRHRPQLAVAAHDIRGRGLRRLSSRRLADRAKRTRHQASACSPACRPWSRRQSSSASDAGRCDSSRSPGTPPGSPRRSPVTSPN